MIFKFRNKKYKLRRGPHSFILSKLTERIKDTEEFDSEHVYYKDLAGVFKYLYDEHVLDEGDYLTIKDHINAIKKDLEDLLNAYEFKLEEKIS